MGEKSIAKNTIFLYFRMLIVMFVSLYTSRIIINILGVSDYGIYQAVGGIVILFSFLNSALSSGSSRFLTISIGKGDFVNLQKTFSTLLLTHIVLAFIIIILGETVGILLLEKKIIIDVSRMYASRVVFQFSIITCVLTIIQVPFTSVIIAREDLSIYAYVGIIEVVLKFIVAYAIKYTSIDKLIIYSFLLFFVQLIIVSIYVCFCIKKYDESKFHIKFLDFSIFKSVAAYSSWSLFSNAAISVVNQGTLILINNFFNPAIVSSRSVALTVTNTANQFINNFRTAANPQILKRYSKGDYEGSENLLLESTAFSFYLMLMLAIPIYFLAEPLLKLWLGIVPEYSVIFLKWGAIQSLFCVFDSSLFVALTAKGRIKENAIICPTICILQFPMIYIFFKMGFSPVIISYISCFIYAVISIVAKPILVAKIVGYKLLRIYKIIARCFLVCLVSFIPVYFMTKFIDVNKFIGFLLVLVLSMIIVLLTVVFIGINKNQREYYKNIILHKFWRKG